MKDLKNSDFREISLEECREINGGVIALAYTVVALCVTLYKATTSNQDSLV